MVDPKIGGEKIWEPWALELLCWDGWWRKGFRRFLSDKRFQFLRADVVNYPFALQKLRPVKVRNNIDDVKGSQFAFGGSCT